MLPNGAFKVRKLLKFLNKGHGQYIETNKEIFFKTLNLPVYFFEKYR